MSEQTQKKALRIPAHIISYLLHPVFMPIVMTLLLYKLMPASFAGIHPNNLGKLLLPVFFLTAIFPVVGTLLTKGVGFIESIHMHNSKDRIIPLIITMIFYFWAYNISKHLDFFPLLLKVLLLGCYLGIIGIFLINIFFKISMHTTAAGGVLGLMVILMMSSPVNMAIPLFVSLFLAGLVGTARKIVGTHSNPEIWMGYLVGFIVQLIAYWWLV